MRSPCANTRPPCSLRAVSNIRYCGHFFIPALGSASSGSSCSISVTSIPLLFRFLICASCLRLCYYDVAFPPTHIDTKQANDSPRFKGLLFRNYNLSFRVTIQCTAERCSRQLPSNQFLGLSQGYSTSAVLPTCITNRMLVPSIVVLVLLLVFIFVEW